VVGLELVRSLKFKEHSIQNIRIDITGPCSSFELREALFSDDGQKMDMIRFSAELQSFSRSISNTVLSTSKLGHLKKDRDVVTRRFASYQAQTMAIVCCSTLESTWPTLPNGLIMTPKKTRLY
jgi:hypothetical protein